MRTMRAIALVLAGLTSSLATSIQAQIVINELVINERNYTGNQTDTGEFVELYNSGGTAIDLSGWVIATRTLANAASTSHTITSGTINPGDYFVVGMNGVNNLDFDLGATAVWGDGAARILQLQNPSATVMDAVAYEVYRNGATGLTQATVEQQAQVGSGYQGQLFSFIDNFAPNERTSLSRYRDGLDSNRNGYDFGHLPLTPGTSNNVPINANYIIPDVDSLFVTAEVPDYHASFVMPRAVDPTVNDGVFNFRSLPASSPQGGNAIIAWDPVGGGNTTYSDELVNNFDLFAYFDTTPLSIPVGTERYEASAYGIGTSDGRFATADPLGEIAGVTAVTENASTGIGWYYQRWETDAANSAKLLLIDFGDGGNSDPSADQWQIKQEIDLATMSSGWFRLGIDYDPDTGKVIATFDDQTFIFTTETDLMGTFYVGYRETVDNAYLHLLSPPVFDQFIAGDYDKDGDVDANDYVVWRRTIGSAASPAGGAADGNSDGTISAADYVVWRDNFAPGIVVGSGESAVPEPASWLLASLGLLAFAIRRRVFGK